MVCQLQTSDSSSEFGYNHFYDGFLNETGGYDFYTADSEIAQEKLGNFAFRRTGGL